MMKIDGETLGKTVVQYSQLWEYVQSKIIFKKKAVVLEVEDANFSVLVEICDSKLYGK